MGINLKDPTITKDAEELAAKYGISVEKAIGLALRKQLARDDDRSDDEIIGNKKYGHFEEETPKERKASFERARAIIKAFRTLPLLDNRSEDEFLGYNEHGTFE